MVLHALQHTTHPSAFDPIFEIVDTILRTQAHPNFIRWAICNANKPRVIFLKGLGILGILGSFLALILLILSDVPRWWRITVSGLLLISVTTVVAAFKGMCMAMRLHFQRDLNPWELDVTDPASTFGVFVKPPPTTPTRSFKSASVVNDSEVHLRTPSIGEAYCDQIGEKRMTVNTFGSNNDWDHEEWVSRYKKRSLYRKFFPGSTWVQAPEIKKIQSRIIRDSYLWGLLVTVVVVAGFTAIPKGNFY